MVRNLLIGLFISLTEFLKFISVSAEFDISLTQVNWLGNAANCVFLVACPAVPYLCAKMGIRNSVSDSRQA